MGKLAENIYIGPWSDSITADHIAKAKKLKPKKPVLSDRASEVWDDHAPEMVYLNRLDPRFVRMFAEWCYQVARLEWIRSWLEEHGDLYDADTRNGYQLKCHPYVAQAHEHFRQMMSLTVKFGLTPHDERLLIKAATGKEQADEFGDFT